MKTLDLIEQTWKKHASTAVDKKDIEKAFMDQAYVFISNKCGPLMKDPFRLGFEIVYKNDKDNRLVGIFAFRVSKELFYAPVFFLSGDIKGSDLLYRVKTKKFSPLSEDWAEYWVENVDVAEGEGVDRSETAKMPTNVAVDRLAFPPYSSGAGFKVASDTSKEIEAVEKHEKEWPDFLSRYHKATGVEYDETQDSLEDAQQKITKHEKKAAWDAFFKEASEQKPIQKGILAELVAEEGGAAVLEKLACAIEASYEFADALARNVDVRTLVPTAVKKASAPKPLVTCHMKLAAGLPKEAADAMFNDGFFFYDARPQEAMTVVFSANQESLEMVSAAGDFEVLKTDGDVVKAFVAPQALDDLDWGGSDNSPVSCPTPEGWTNHEPPMMVVVFEDGRVALSRGVLGKPLAPEAKNGEGSTWLLDTMSSGKAYRLFDKKAGTLSEPVKVISKRSRAGIDIYEVKKQWGRNTHTLRKNPDYDGGLKDGVFGDNIAFVEVKVKSNGDDEYNSFDEEHDDVAGTGDLEKWILKQPNIKKASIAAAGGEFLIRLGNDTSEPLDKRAAVAVLAQLGIGCDMGLGMVNTVLEKGEQAYQLKFEKEGSYGPKLLRVPEFQHLTNSEFSVNMEIPQSFRVGSETQTDDPLPNRVGDAWDPGMGQGSQEKQKHLPAAVLESASPNQLAQLAQSEDLPNVFEHGAVASLVKTFDSSATIDKYIPKLVDALDAQGRILFLFYWKPKDYQEAYGVDDMEELEDDLTSNFQSFGELTLNLIKQSRKKRPGSVALD